MPLSLKEVPSDDLLTELNRRYPHMIFVGTNTEFVKEHFTDCIYIQGNILVNMGLWLLTKEQLLDGWAENCSDASGRDAP